MGTMRNVNSHLRNIKLGLLKGYGLRSPTSSAPSHTQAQLLYGSCVPWYMHTHGAPQSVLVPKSETVPKSGDTTFGREAAMEKKSASDKAILLDENVHSSSTGELTGGNMRPNIPYTCVGRQLPP